MSDQRVQSEHQLECMAGETLSQLHLRGGGPAAVASEISALARHLWRANQASAVAVSLSDIPIGNVEAILTDSPVVQKLATDQDAVDGRPIVWQNGHLYMLRYWHAENTISQGILTLAATEVLPTDPVRAGAAALDSVVSDPIQRHAVQTALRRSLLVLTGGPGTGKTTTLGAIVRAWQQHNPGSRIALAAPTGKAATRLMAAIEGPADPPGSQKSAGSVAAGTQPNAPLAATLHRLLGYGIDGSFMHGADNPLPYDLVIIDECSMIDAMLGARLMQSLPPTTRLVLAGDRDQLSSVEPGAFFGAVCAACESVSEAAAESVDIGGCFVALRTNYRQSDSPQIVDWAQAVRAGTLGVDRPPSGRQVFLHEHEPHDAFESAVTQALAAYLPLVQRAGEVTEVTDDAAVSLLQAFQSVRLLAVLRAGPMGVDALNARMVALLRAQSEVQATDWFAGRLVIVTRNMPSQNLFNGDIGLTVRSSQGGLTVIFDNGAGVMRLLPLEMPPHDDAFALTVHQSQGSDFDNVILLPAPARHPLAVRSALYTAITRARRLLHIHAMASDLQWAASHGDVVTTTLTERICRAAGRRR